MAGIGYAMRVPLEIAEARGRTLVNPARYKDCVKPMADRLQPATVGMDGRIAPWFEHWRENACWLRETDRDLVTAHCIFSAMIHEWSCDPLRDDNGRLVYPFTEKEIAAFHRSVKLLGFCPTTRQNVQIEREQDEREMF